jgi:hypothetical protein
MFFQHARQQLGPALRGVDDLAAFVHGSTGGQQSAHHDLAQAVAPRRGVEPAVALDARDELVHLGQPGVVARLHRVGVGQHVELAGGEISIAQSALSSRRRL